MIATVKTIYERSGTNAEAIAAMLSLDVEAVRVALAPQLTPAIATTVKTLAETSGMSSEAIAATPSLDVDAGVVSRREGADARREKIRAAQLGAQQKRQQALYRERWLAIQEKRDKEAAAARDAEAPSAFAREQEARHNERVAAAAAAAARLQPPVAQERVPAVGDEYVPMGQPVADYPPVGPPRVQRSDSEVAREMQRDEYAMQGNEYAQPPFGPPRAQRSDSEIAREMQRDINRMDRMDIAEKPVPPPLGRRQPSWMAEHEIAAKRPAPAVLRRQPSWMQEQEPFGAAAAGFDALGVLSYTVALPDGTAGDPVNIDTFVRDGRVALEAGRISLREQGFTLEYHPTDLKQAEFYKPDNVSKRYYKEQEELIKRAYGAKTVVVLNDIVRNAGKADRRGNANPFAGGGNGVNGYANVVHTDFRAAKAVEKFDQRPKRRQYPHGKYMLINTWRNISNKHPIYNNTLACCDQQTVDSPGDYISVDVPLTKDAHAEQYRLTSKSAPRHEWYYFPHMMQDEVLLFTQFDSDTNAPARFCFHTAFNDPTVDPKLPQRESVEVRAIAFFEPKVFEPKDGVAFSRHALIGELQRQLAQGAANGLVEASELPNLMDLAAYNGAQNEDFLFQLCTDRGINYRPFDWQPDEKADAVLEELKALKTFERAAFLEPPKHRDEFEAGRLNILMNSEEARDDLAELQRMFPRLDLVAIKAVYRGFAGNFETAAEMLALALAEEREGEHH